MSDTSELADPSVDTGFLQRNSAWIAPGDHIYNTDLGPQEPAFRQWATANKVPFDVNAPVSDYDMRGFYQGLQTGDPKAVQAVNPNDGKMHFPDYWKTPLHESFSADSQWADPAKAPRWNEKDQLVLPDGSLVYDEKKAQMHRVFKQFLSNKAVINGLRSLAGAIR